MKSVLEMLGELMACRAITSEVANVNSAVAVMRKYAEEAGLFVSEEDFDGRKALYVSTEPGKVADYLLNAHLDVVVAPDDSMFVPRVEGDKIYGRGVHDDQGQAICALRVMANLRGKASVGTIFSTDEEHGGHTTGGMVARGYVGRKVGLVLDGPSCSIAIAQKGIITLHLKAYGTAGHSSVPWCFDNALDKLIDGYLKFRAVWPTVTAEDSWQNTMQATVARAGDPRSSNQIPDEAEMTLNIRYVNEEDYDVILAQAKELTGLEVKASAHKCRPVYTDEKDPMIQRLMAEIGREYPDRKIGTSKMHGATDARHMMGIGIPIGIIGLPGDGAHARDEWMSISGFEKYERLLTRYCAEC